MAYSRRSFLLGIPTLAAAAAVVSPGTAAATAPHESPVRISSRTATPDPDLPELVLDYARRVDLRVHYASKDNGGGCGVRGAEETVEAEVPTGAGAVELDGVRYELTGFHFHTPSEHVLDGHRFPIEQHFVHSGPDGQTLVLALFLAGGGRGGDGDDDGDRLRPAHEAVLRELPEECGGEHEVTGDLAAALPRDVSTFRYDGSLTTSPFSGPVSWLVLKEHRTVSWAATAGVRNLFPDGNARELQPLGDRVVRYRGQR